VEEHTRSEGFDAGSDYESETPGRVTPEGVTKVEPRSGAPRRNETLLDDELADELTAEPHVAILCGRYEGFDDRVHEHLADDEVSIGRYVLAGGELPAMVLADVVMRKLPGALGHEQSAVEESFSQRLEGMPEYPHYTRPPQYRGWGVPEVLLSGDHERVRLWRAEQSQARAQQLEKRPE